MIHVKTQKLPKIICHQFFHNSKNFKSVPIHFNQIIRGIHKAQLHTKTLKTYSYNTSLFSTNKNQQQKKQLSFQQKIKQYQLLCRNDKPIGTMLLYWPTAWGVILGTMSSGTTFTCSTFYLLSLFFMGSWTSRSAGCIVNDMLDQQFDKKVQRTKTRPLAAGLVSMKQAGALLFLNLCGGLIVLFHLPYNALIFTMGIVMLAGLYPLAKRYTYYPQIVLGIGFNSGIIIAALTGNPEVNLSILLPFYTSGILWTLIYDTAYAYQDIKDDLLIGVKSTAIAWRNKNPKKIMQYLGWTMAVLHGILPLIDKNLWVTSSLLVLCDYQLIRSLRQLDLSNREACGQFFRFNNYYGMSIFIALGLGAYYYENMKQITNIQSKQQIK